MYMYIDGACMNLAKLLENEPEQQDGLVDTGQPVHWHVQHLYQMRSPSPAFPLIYKRVDC